MEPIRLEIENFCSYSKSNIDFTDFTSALIIGKIRGNDKFSNGAGKSTVFAAIKYALFNKVDFSILDRIVRHGCEHCQVIFEFKADSSEIYRITRKYSKRSGTDIRLARKNGATWEEITQRKPSETEKDIAKIIKINYKTFCNSVLFSQSDLLNGLAAITPGDRKKALKEALQLNVYSVFEKVAKLKAAGIIKEIDTAKTILGTVGDPVKDITDIDKKLADIEELLTTQNQLCSTTKEKLEAENKTFSSLNTKFELLEKQASESAAKQKLLQGEITNFTSAILEYDKKLAVLKKEGTQLSEEVAALTAKAKSSNKTDIVKLQQELTKLSASIVDKTVSQRNIEMKLKDLNMPLPKDGTCKHCRQPITEEHRKTCLEQIATEIKELSSQKDSLDKEIKSLQLREAAMNKEKAAYELGEKETITLKNSLEIKKKDIEHKRALYVEYTDFADKAKASLEQKNAEFDKLKKSQFMQNADEYAKLKSDISNTKARIVLLSKEMEDVSKLISSMSNNKAVLLSKKEERTNDIEKIKSIKDNIKSLEDKFSLHQKVVQAFGSAGIPALITHTILDDFQLETNNLLTQLRPGLQAQFSVVKDRDDGDQEDTLDITYMLNGYDLEYAQLSGAQKLIASLCLKLGLASVIKKRLGTDIKLLLIDEADQSLDDGILEAFEDAIKKLQKDFKVLVITHREKLKENFTHAILVEQDENFVSTAKVVNTW